MNPNELRAALARGENIMAMLRREHGARINSEEFIEASYDLRAGTDIEQLEDPEHAQYVRDSAGEIARLLRQYGQPASLLEAGVGEAATLSHVLQLTFTGSIFVGLEFIAPNNGSLRKA
jgi:hypothetical protein